MASLNASTATINIADDDKKRVCSVNNVSPSVSPDTAAAFVSAIETLHNNGACKAQLRIVYDLEP